MTLHTVCHVFSKILKFVIFLEKSYNVGVPTRKFGYESTAKSTTVVYDVCIY